MHDRATETGLAGRHGARGWVGDRRRIAARRAEARRRNEAARRVEKDVDRLAFFSDAIFAIAITLLVLRISVPPESVALGPALAERWPSFLVFVISFLVIGRYWTVHHRMFRSMRGYDARLITIDLFMMLCICFLPYPTELLGTHQEEPLSVVLYASTVIFTSLTSAALWWYAERHGFLDNELTPARVRALRYSGLSIPVLFAISIPVAYIDTTAAMLVWTGSVVLRPLDMYLTRRAGG